MLRKRLLSALVAVMMILSMLPTFAFAATGITVTAANTEIYQGTTTAKVEIKVSENPGIAYLSFKVGYNADKMSLTSVETSSDVFASDDFIAGDTSANPYSVLAANYTKNTSNNGIIVTLNFTVDADCPAGTYDISLSAAEAYTIDENTVNVNLVNGSIKVSQKPITGVTFTDSEFTYDGTEKQIAVKGTLPTGATVDYTNNKGTDVGTYNATAVVKANGYEDLTLNAKMIIKPKNLTVSGLTAENKTYDGTTDATVKGGTLSGVVTGDDVSATFPTTGTFASANAGSNITVSIADVTLDGADKDNYSLTQPSALKANITKASLTVKADDKVIKKGGAIPELTFTITEGTLMPGDALTGNLVTSADGSRTGDFTINKGTLAASNNYELAFIQGTLSVVDKTPQNIVVNEFSNDIYGDSDWHISVTADPLANLSAFEYSSSNTDVATVDEQGNVTIVGVGTTVITVTEPGDENFAPFSYEREYAVYEKTIELISINIVAKDADFEGLVDCQDTVNVDFSKAWFYIENKVEGTDYWNVMCTDLSLTGEGSENYFLSDSIFFATVEDSAVASVSATAENGSVSTLGNFVKGTLAEIVATPDSGYVFAGWYVGEELVCTSETYRFTISDDVELVAKFEKESYTSSPWIYVYFDCLGGEDIGEILVREGETVSVPAAPERQGYAFVGWYSDRALENEFDFDTPIMVNTVVYAKWIESDAVWNNPFTDVEEDAWYYDAIQFACTSGLMNGMTDEEFAPDTALTRGMLVTIIYRIEGEPDAEECNFVDVEAGSWYENAIAWAYENGIVKGTADSEFAPDAIVTREQMATMICRYAGYKGYEVNGATGGEFADADQISDYAKDAVEWVSEKSIMNGNPDGSFDSAGESTRAQVAAVFMRLLNFMR